MVTFFGILKPFDKFLHLFQEVGLSFVGVIFRIPAKDNVFT